MHALRYSSGIFPIDLGEYRHEPRPFPGPSNLKFPGQELQFRQADPEEISSFPPPSRDSITGQTAAAVIPPHWPTHRRFSTALASKGSSFADFSKSIMAFFLSPIASYTSARSSRARELCGNASPYWLATSRAALI